MVNSLDEELAIDLGENVEVTTETLYEVLAGASAGGTSINHVCETTDDSPHANTVQGHLTAASSESNVSLPTSLRSEAVVSILCGVDLTAVSLLSVVDS